MVIRVIVADQRNFLLLRIIQNVGLFRVYKKITETTAYIFYNVLPRLHAPFHKVVIDIGVFPLLDHSFFFFFSVDHRVNQKILDTIRPLFFYLPDNLSGLSDIALQITGKLRFQ